MHSQLLRLMAANRGRGLRKLVEARAGAERGESTLYLYDYIVDTDAEAEYFGGVSAESVAKDLRALGGGPLSVRVNSPGGSVFGGRVIEQALREYRGEVTVHIDGLAASAASFLIMPANRIIAGSGAMMMIHRGWTLAMGDAPAFEQLAGLLTKIDLTIAATYAVRGSKSADEYLELMSATTWYTAREAQDDGLVDEVSDSKAPEDDDVKAKAQASLWDVSALEAFTPHSSAAQAEDGAAERIARERLVMRARAAGIQRKQVQEA